MSSCNNTSAPCVRRFHGCAAVQSTSTYLHGNKYEATDVTWKEKNGVNLEGLSALLFRPAQGDHPYKELGAEK